VIEHRWGAAIHSENDLIALLDEVQQPYQGKPKAPAATVASHVAA
jgi:hypothetical protein